MPYRAILVAAVAAGAVQAQPAFQPPLAVPAAKSSLALQSSLDALVPAGRRLVAAGQRGHILYSDDGGGAWQQAAVPLSTDLTALWFADAKQGWAVGHQGVILHTEDGGATWAKQYVAEADKSFLDVWFEDERRGFAIGAFNLILRTEDGGKTWTSWSDHVDNPKALHLYSIRPAAGTLFIASEQGLVLKLDREQQRFVPVALPYQGTLFGVVGTPDMVLVFGLRGNAWRSTDGGANWSRAETHVAAGLTSGVVRADGSVVLGSQAGHVLVSSDGGASFGRAQVARPVPVFALAGAGKDSVALAGPAGVRVEALK